MTRKRSMVDIDLPDRPLAKTLPVGRGSDPTARRGPMAKAIAEMAISARERHEIEAQIRLEGDAPAHEHFRRGHPGLMADLVPLDLIGMTRPVRDRKKGPDAGLLEPKAPTTEPDLSNPIRLEARADGQFELIQGHGLLTFGRPLKKQPDRPPAGKVLPIRERDCPLGREREERPALPPPARDAATKTRAARANPCLGRRTGMKHTLLSVVLATALALPVMAQDDMTMAPAAPGGGWDGTARAMKEVMQAEGIAASVQVQNVPGAGGTVGLAQFASTGAGDPGQLIVGGYVMVGAILTNVSPATLSDVAPIARLRGEAVGIAVSASSPIQNISELVEMMKADPGPVSWAGGSAGGVDHITVGLLAKAAGVDPTKINYVAFSGGGEALAAILGNQVTVGISGVGAFLPQVEAGTTRMLAVSTAE